MTSFKEALSKVILNFKFFIVNPCAPNLVTAINCFFTSLKKKLSSSLITFFSLFCGTSV